MAHTCKACTHPERRAVDLAVVKREPLNQVAKDFGIGRDVLRRHVREHLPELLEAAYRAERQEEQSDLKKQASRLYDETERLFEKCKSGKIQPTSMSACLRAVKEIRANIELLRRIRDGDELEAKLDKFNELMEAEETRAI